MLAIPMASTRSTSAASSPLAAAALVFGVSLTLYVVTLAPTLSWSNFGADGGDLISAAATLGVRLVAQTVHAPA